MKKIKQFFKRIFGIYDIEYSIEELETEVRELNITTKAITKELQDILDKISKDLGTIRGFQKEVKRSQKETQERIDNMPKEITVRNVLAI